MRPFHLLTELEVRDGVVAMCEHLNLIGGSGTGYDLYQACLKELQKAQQCHLNLEKEPEDLG